MHDEGAGSWKRWKHFLRTIEFPDDTFISFVNDPKLCNIIIFAFSQALQEARYSPNHIKQLAEGSISSTSNHMAHVFQSSDWVDLYSTIREGWLSSYYKSTSGIKT